MKKFFLSFALFTFAAMPANAEDIALQSTSETLAEPIATTPQEQAMPEPLPEMAEFSLRDKDIISWEESSEGKYVYFTLTAEKNEELGKVTEAALGKPLRININDNFVVIPEVSAVLNQKNGFVLNVPEKGNRFVLIRMLDPGKKAHTSTALSIGGETADKEK